MVVGKTDLNSVVDPQVMAEMIREKLEAQIRFAPLARVDNTLVGQAGSTVTVPKWSYIGDAGAVIEGGAIDVTKLESNTEDFTIQKAGKGVEITDEAVLSGYGDPVGEAGQQLMISIAQSVDNDLLTALNGATLTTDAGVTFDGIDAAQGEFNDEDTEPMVLIAHPKDVATLRKTAGDNWSRASDLGDSVLVSGVFGEVLGAQVVRSKKVTEGEAYLVKAGALAIYLKRDALVENDRDIIHKTTVMTADQHYGAHLYDASKAVKITTL